MDILAVILLVFIIGCALAVVFSKNLLQAIVIYMSLSLAMCILWILLESPDLAITEAAVGAGIDTLLLLLTLKKLRAIDTDKDSRKPAEKKEAAKLGEDQ